MPIINSLLDSDTYKYTMQQVVFHRFPGAEAEFTFTCRTPGIDLRPYAGEIEAEIAHFCELRLSSEEIAYLSTLPYLKPSYLDMLRNFQLDSSAVQIVCDSEFHLRLKGNWVQTILFEVPVLAIINEVYFRNTHPMTSEVRTEGLRRLTAKCDTIRLANRPDFRLIEFGTRRRYSREWQDTVIAYLTANLPEYFLGSSNIAAAQRYCLKRYGTMAHEFLQACQAFVALPDFQKFALETWMQEYRGQLGIALSDVVGVDAFLRDFDRLFCMAYDGARHDSGDPILWGDKLIAHYEQFGIDPRTKTAVFTDGLDIPRALELANYFAGRIQTQFGIGTNLTNDFDFPALQIVIKMTRCNGRPVAKLSDTPGKTMCEDVAFMNYLREIFFPQIGSASLS